MMPAPAPLRALRTPARLLALLGVLALAACWPTAPPGTRPAPGRLRAEVLRVLDVQTPSPAYYRERSRLEVLGRELDEILFWLVQDQSLAEHVRANAVSLLADRGTPGSLVLLRRVLVSSGDDAVRLAAVTGIQRFAADSPQARNALRAAVGDPSQLVRLNALQGLDVEDVGVLRSILTRDPDPQVRLIARQLLTLFEARGAPLQADAQGDLRTAPADSTPRIVFHAAQRDSVGGPQIGGLWVELGERRLVPLAQRVEVVEGVVPAFFNGAGTMVVFEAEREIRVRDLATGQTRVVGPGVAPRAIPFSERFVFLQELRAERRDTADATALTYRVMTVPFAGGTPVALGLLRAMSRPDRMRGASPVRRMVVGELRQGFVLRGPGVTPFVLPSSPESAAPR